MGVTLGEGAVGLAFGALLLFASNVVALVLAGTLTFTAAGYATEAYEARGFPPRRAYLAIAGLVAAVLVPLAANTAGNILVTIWTAQVRSAAEDWLAGSGQSSVDTVRVGHDRAVVTVRSDEDLPPVEDLKARLAAILPGNMDLTVVLERGRSIDTGPLSG